MVNFLQLPPFTILDTLSRLEKIDRVKSNEKSFATARLAEVVYGFLGGKNITWTDFLPFKNEIKSEKVGISEETKFCIEFAFKNSLVSPQILASVSLLLEE